MRKFDYLKPRTIEEALTLLARHGKNAALIAGGTDVIVMIKQKAITPDVLISLQGIPGLDRIRYNGSLSMGAMVTHRAIEKSEDIRRNFSALSDAADFLGSVQIRNVATVGGNICTAAPSADTATPLLVLGARVKIKTLAGERVIPIEDFFRGPGKTALEPGEMVEELVLPSPPSNTGSAYHKLQRRLALDLPILGVSVFLSLDRNRIASPRMHSADFPISSVLHEMEREGVLCTQIRIGLGVAAPTPIRAVKAEALLRGKKISDELLADVAETAAQEAQPRDTLRGESWYRRDMIRVLTKRMAMRCIERVVQPGAKGFPARPW